MAGYAIAPGAMHVSTFLWAGLGTGLCSSSANAFNQVCEKNVCSDCFFVVMILGLLCSLMHAMYCGSLCRVRMQDIAGMYNCTLNSPVITVSFTI